MCSDLIRLTSLHFGMNAPSRGREHEMLTSAECRAHAEEKLAQAERDRRLRKRFNRAAEGWLLLASRLRQIEASVVATKDRAMRRRCVGSAQQEMKRV
jgi:hypothetical protein